MKKNRTIFNVVVTGVFACLCTSLMVVGVLASTQHNLNITSTIKFVSSDVQGTIKAYTLGAQINHYYNSQSTASAENAIDGTKDGDAIAFNATAPLNKGWNTGELLFNDSENPDDITLSFEFTNSGETEMWILLTGLNCFANADSNNIEVSYTVTGAQTSTYNVTTQTAIPTTQIFFDVGDSAAKLSIILHVISSDKDVSFNNINLGIQLGEKSSFPQM